MMGRPGWAGGDAGAGWELAFSAATLHEVREAVVARAAMAGIAGDRAIDVMLAVHELAANAVRHGAGRGRLRMHVTAGSLYWEISDAGRANPDGRARLDVQAGNGTRPAAGRPRGFGGSPWPVEPGHGLWLVCQVCDEVSAASGPGGSRVTAVFSLPAGTGWSAARAGGGPRSGDG
jgi:anti-sigma regulatory factor (Ser/Thr protein kinase)